MERFDWPSRSPTSLICEPILSNCRCVCHGYRIILHSISASSSQFTRDNIDSGQGFHSSVLMTEIITHGSSFGWRKRSLSFHYAAGLDYGRFSPKSQVATELNPFNSVTSNVPYTICGKVYTSADGEGKETREAEDSELRCSLPFRPTTYPSMTLVWALNQHIVRV